MVGWGNVVGHAWSSAGDTGSFVTGCGKIGVGVEPPVKIGLTLGVLFSDDLQCDLSGPSFAGSVDIGAFPNGFPSTIVNTTTGNVALEWSFTVPPSGIAVSAVLCWTLVTDEYA